MFCFSKLTVQHRTNGSVGLRLNGAERGVKSSLMCPWNAPSCAAFAQVSLFESEFEIELELTPVKSELSS